MADIKNLSMALKSLSALASAGSQLAHLDLKALAAEALDLDEVEAAQLAKDLEGLDLWNDEIEKKIEEIGGSIAKSAVILIRIIKLFVLKQG